MPASLSVQISNLWYCKMYFNFFNQYNFQSKLYFKCRKHTPFQIPFRILNLFEIGYTILGLDLSSLQEEPFSAGVACSHVIKVSMGCFLASKCLSLHNIVQGCHLVDLQKPANLWPSSTGVDTTCLYHLMSSLPITMWDLPPDIS